MDAPVCVETTLAEKPPPPPRLARTALLIHGLAWVAGVSGVIFFRWADKTQPTTYVPAMMSGIAATVFLVWSLLLAIRSFVFREDSRLAVGAVAAFLFTITVVSLLPWRYQWRGQWAPDWVVMALDSAPSVRRETIANMLCLSAYPGTDYSLACTKRLLAMLDDEDLVVRRWAAYYLCWTGYIHRRLWPLQSNPHPLSPTSGVGSAPETPEEMSERKAVRAAAQEWLSRQDATRANPRSR